MHDVWDLVLRLLYAFEFHIAFRLVLQCVVVGGIDYNLHQNRACNTVLLMHLKIVCIEHASCDTDSYLQVVDECRNHKEAPSRSRGYVTVG